MKISLQNHVIRKEDVDHNEAAIDVYVDEDGVQVNVLIGGSIAKRIDINNNGGKIELQVIRNLEILSTQDLEKGL